MAILPSPLARRCLAKDLETVFAQIAADAHGAAV